MTAPEACARQSINAQLTSCGWMVQDRARVTLHIGREVVLREEP